MIDNQPRPITWGVVRYEKIHFDCATEAEVMLTWAAFNGPDHPDADDACARCGVSLREEVPQP